MPRKPAPTTEKLQKVLARAGLGSRRQMETYIEAGRVSVNGKRAKLGDRVLAKDTVRVDGIIIQATAAPETTRVILYHKPVGEICTRDDPGGRPTVFDHLPRLHHQRWVSIGRLDINTEGLLLFTNNGELANRLMHPRTALEREYAVRVRGEIAPEVVRQLTTGVRLEDGMASFQHVLGRQDVGGSNRWYYVVVKEGRNRIVRRLLESQGIQINRLKRVRFGSIVLPRSLREGDWQELSSQEVRAVCEMGTSLEEKG